jgi:hypothetical protein
MIEPIKCLLVLSMFVNLYLLCEYMSFFYDFNECPFDLRDSLRYAPEISTAFSAANPPNGSARDVPWRNLTAARPDFFAFLVRPNLRGSYTYN